MVTDFFNWTGDMFQKFFKIMPMIGNRYNMLMVVTAFVALLIWLWVQSKYNKKAEDEGTLK